MTPRTTSTPPGIKPAGGSGGRTPRKSRAEVFYGELALSAKKAGADVLVFYSKSRDVKPGQGVHEIIVNPRGRAQLYDRLAAVPDWRKVLSNFHECDFPYDGLRYRTIEHAFQAEKIRLVNRSAAFEFSLDSGSDLSRGGGDAARKARKIVMLPKDLIAYWDSISMGKMAEIAMAKYSHCEAAREVLFATGGAWLVHFQPRGQPGVRFEHLESIRKALGSRVLEELFD